VTLEARVAGKQAQVEGQMVARFSSIDVTFPGLSAIPAGSKITFSAVNDYGAIVNTDALVKYHHPVPGPLYSDGRYGHRWPRQQQGRLHR